MNCIRYGISFEVFCFWGGGGILDKSLLVMSDGLRCTFEWCDFYSAHVFDVLALFDFCY